MFCVDLYDKSNLYDKSAIESILQQVHANLLKFYVECLNHLLF